MKISFILWTIDPEIINVAGFSLRYYGVLFAGGLLLSVSILKWIFKNENLSHDKLDTLTLYGVIGIVLGARLGHCLFYEPGYYLAHPAEILLPVSFLPSGEIEFVGYQGLASHGGALGLILALVFYSRKTKHALLDVMDLLSVVAALGGAFIRLGNLMNSEIVGTPTTVPWAFVFERVDSVPRHPAQLYEAICYLLIFTLLLFLYKTRRAALQKGFFFGLILVLVFTCRFILEFFKENQVGFENTMTINMGQLLSLPYILVGIGFLIYAFLPAKKETDQEVSVE